MTKLAPLKSQLAALRRRRQLWRWGTGWLALATAVLGALAGVFLIDWLFQRSLDLPQRLLLDGLALAALVWAFRKFTRPWLGIREDELALALLVEHQQKIDSDLVAALQFERPEAAAWGSPQLESAVIDRVAQIGTRLNVFTGTNGGPCGRRAAVFVATALILLLLAAVFPQHALVFFQRLLLGAQHYPTRTQIAAVVVNERLVLESRSGAAAPAPLNAPEGRAVEFLVKCRGDLPEQGAAELVSATSGQRRELELRQLTLADRKALLLAAQTRLTALEGAAPLPPTDPSLTSLVAQLALDAPALAERLASAGEIDQGLVAQLRTELARQLAAWPGDAAAHAVFAASLPRHADPLRYQLYLGDAWTDAATLGLVPLPLVQTQFTVKPPAYAASAKLPAPQAGDRQIAVLEGAQVHVAIACANKPLASAYVLFHPERDAAAAPQRFALAPVGNDRRTWRLEAGNSPLTPVRQSLAYEIQVLDEDGLSLPEPLAGRLMLRDDRPPAVNLAVQDRIWLPTATPKLRYTVRDDYGVDRMLLHVRVEHHDGRTSTATQVLRAPGHPLLAEQLPLSSTATLELAALKLAYTGDNSAHSAEKPELARGDRVEITLEVFDFRGPLEGKSAQSETVTLPIGQQSDILTVVDRSLGNAEEKATVTIDTQTGIGDSP